MELLLGLGHLDRAAVLSAADVLLASRGSWQHRELEINRKITIQRDNLEAN